MPRRDSAKRSKWTRKGEDLGNVKKELPLQPVAADLTVGVPIQLLSNRPDVKAADKRYLVFGIGSAVACTICLVFAVYFSVGGTQTLEVGMVNY